MPTPSHRVLPHLRRGRAAAWAGLLVLVLLAHLMFLGWLPARRAPAQPFAAAPAPLRPVMLVPMPVRAVPVASTEPAPPEPVPAPLVRRVALRPPVVAKPALALAVPAVAPMADPSPRPELAETRIAAAEPAAPRQPTPEAAVEVPVYATRMPPSFTLEYELRRGLLSGTGELRWRKTNAGYELELAGSVLGLSVIGWSSRGAFDSAGIAPLRYVDQRRGKSAVAANFQREIGRVSFSGPPVTYPLVPGTQDRLSWMVQLPAIFEADPARWHAGTRVELFVVGAHGEADLWTFIVRGFEPVEVPSGRLEAAMLLQREPQRPYDTRVDVWLDPARHHLPARARLTSMPSGDALELSLRTYHLD